MGADNDDDIVVAVDRDWVVVNGGYTEGVVDDY